MTYFYMIGEKDNQIVNPNTETIPGVKFIFSFKLFDLNEKEKDMIIKHMWPVTVEFPKSLEGFILTFVDKHCAMSETFEVLKSRLFMKKAFRYAYVFLSLVIIKF